MSSLRYIIFIILLVPAFTSCLHRNEMAGTYTLKHIRMDFAEIPLIRGQKVMEIRDGECQLELRPVWALGGRDAGIVITPISGNDYVLNEFSVTSPYLAGIDISKDDIIKSHYYSAPEGSSWMEHLLKLPEQISSPRKVGLRSMCADMNDDMCVFRLRITSKGRAHDIEIQGIRDVKTQWVLPGTER
jgi:hypothetical protein